MGGEEEEEEEDGLSGQPIDKRLNCEFGSDWLRRQLRAQKEKNVEWPGPPPFSAPPPAPLPLLPLLVVVVYSDCGAEAETGQFNQVIRFESVVARKRLAFLL